MSRLRHRRVRPHSGPSRHLNPPFGAKRRHGGRLHLKAEGSEAHERHDRPKARKKQVGGGVGSTAGGTTSGMTPAQLQMLQQSSAMNQPATTQLPYNPTAVKRGGRVHKRARGGKVAHRQMGGAAAGGGGPQLAQQALQASQQAMKQRQQQNQQGSAGAMQALGRGLGTNKTPSSPGQSMNIVPPGAGSKRGGRVHRKHGGHVRKRQAGGSTNSTSSSQLNNQAQQPTNPLLKELNQPYSQQQNQAQSSRAHGGRMEEDCEDGRAEGGGKWIQGAIKHKGALHRALGVPEGEKIPAKKMAKAAHSDNPRVRKMAGLAKTLKKMH